MIRILLELLKAIFSFSEKASKPEEVRIKNNEIKEPLKEKRVEEKLEKHEKKDWVAYVEVLQPRHNRKLKKAIRKLTEWGAEINNIEAQEEYFVIFYTREGVEGSERFKK